jgi:uncharacterized protein YndB with AHSA1/START domain
MPQVAAYSISRVVNAPRELVYKVHTEPKHLAKWLAPEGFEGMTSTMDFRVGGKNHYCQKGKDVEMWGLQVYKEIVPNEKLVYIQSFSNKEGGLSRHPMAPTWPLEMYATTTFEDAGAGKTKITVTWAPYNSDDAGNAAFDGARAGMDGGFGGTFDKLDAYLATLV